MYVSVLVLVAWLAGHRTFATNWLAAGVLDTAVVRGGEYWRTVTALTLHFDVAHLLSNLGFGAFFGWLAAQLLGPGVAFGGAVAAAALANALNVVGAAGQPRLCRRFDHGVLAARPARCVRVAAPGGFGRALGLSLGAVDRGGVPAGLYRRGRRKHGRAGAPHRLRHGRGHGLVARSPVADSQASVCNGWPGSAPWPALPAAWWAALTPGALDAGRQVCSAADLATAANRQMALQQLTAEQVRTWTREQKDRWWFTNVYRGDMPQLTLRSAVTGFLLGGLLSATNLYVGAKTGWTLGVGLTSVILAFAMFRVFSRLGARDMTILENNCVQSIATAAGYMTMPLISGLAAYMWATNQVLPWWQIICFNVVLSMPRRAGRVPDEAPLHQRRAASVPRRPRLRRRARHALPRRGGRDGHVQGEGARCRGGASPASRASSPARAT